jgi:DNA polymerase-3 subunit epsilon
VPYPFYIIIDTETSGMPTHFDMPLDDTTSWPGILQVAWLVLDHDGNLVKEENHYLKNRGIEIDQQAQQLHGITHQLLKEKGVSKRGMLRRLYKDIIKYNALVVGHFIEFDLKMLTVENHRHHLHLDFDGLPMYCTMLMSGVKSHHPDRQHPSLAELYQHCFNMPLKDPHNAIHDARAAASVFLQLVEDGQYSDAAVVKFDAHTGQHSDKNSRENPNLLQKLKSFIRRK